MAVILVVDDEQDIRDLLGLYLKNEGYQVEKAACGEEALELIQQKSIDLILLDVMLPDIDGIKLCMKLRESSHIPIIMVSAKDHDMDKVIGLTSGADDYVSKPFNPVELIARVKAQLRRSVEFSMAVKSDVLECNGLRMQLDTHRVFLDDREVDLTPKEYGILELLWKNSGVVFSTERIYSRIWNEEEYDVDNVVMVHIRNLRMKIERNPKKPEFINTIWGVGYRFGQ
ncbi:MAG: response regulator transcription factor [Lachnospira sp.]|nr:response regulator transcription factor [Lachnospira sp.]